MLQRHQMLTLAIEKKITQKQAAKELGLSLSHTKRLIRRLKENERDPHCLDYQRKHPAPNKTSEEIREKAVALKIQRRERSNPLLSEILKDNFGISLHPSTIRRILMDRGEYTRSHFRRPCRRFEREAFGELVQMDTSDGSWLEGYRRVYLVMLMDDYSRFILAGRFFESDSTYNNMLVLRETIENHGIFPLLYCDNDSKFKVIRHPGSRFFNYKQETLDGEVITEVHQALLELGSALITHEPGNAQAKGKIERLYRTIQERFIPEHTAKNLKELNEQFQKWISWYNHSHVNRDTGTIPINRTHPCCFKPLNGINLDDIFCFKEERKVGKDNSFSLDGSIYTIPREHNMVAFKVQLHIHPGKKIRIWHGEEFLCELPYQNRCTITGKPKTFLCGRRPPW